MARLDSGTPAAARLPCRTKAPHQPQANQPWHAQCPGPRTRPVEQVPAKCSCNTSFPIKWCVQVRAGARLGVPSDGIAAPSGRVFLRGHTPGIRRRGAQGLPIPTFAVLVLSNLALIQTNRSWASVSRESTASLAGSSAGSPCHDRLAGVVLAVPAVGRLFSFVQPSPPLLLAALGGSVLSWMWFEGVKWAFHRRPMR